MHSAIYNKPSWQMHWLITGVFIPMQKSQGSINTSCIRNWHYHHTFLTFHLCFNGCVFAQPCFMFRMKIGVCIINFILLNVLVRSFLNKYRVEYLLKLMLMNLMHCRCIRSIQEMYPKCSALWAYKFQSCDQPCGPFCSDLFWWFTVFCITYNYRWCYHRHGTN